MIWYTYDCKKTPNIKLINTLITSYIYLFSFGWKHLSCTFLANLNDAVVRKGKFTIGSMLNSIYSCIIINDYSLYYSCKPTFAYSCTLLINWSHHMTHQILRVIYFILKVFNLHHSLTISPTFAPPWNNHYVLLPWVYLFKFFLIIFILIVCYCLCYKSCPCFFSPLPTTTKCAHSPTIST